MPEYLCHMNADYSLIVEAESEDEAAQKAANTPTEDWTGPVWSGVEDVELYADVDGQPLPH